MVGGAVVAAGLVGYGLGTLLNMAVEDKIQEALDWAFLDDDDGDDGEAELEPQADGDGEDDCTYGPETYSRPSGFRKGVRDKTWEQNVDPSTGRVRDPVTGRFLNKDEPWDMGHKPGYEFRKHQDSAAERCIDRETFLDEYNDPSHYRPELPESNRGHKGEDLSDDYYGP